jgi:myo-inositol-1(or 4)-monophosphatase
MVFSCTQLKSVALEAALKAGNLLRQGFGTSFKIENKEGKNNLVTEYDKASESCIIQDIRKSFPDHGFLAEESGASDGQEILWIIDPLDGTANFAHNIPWFSISIAATQGEEILCGVVFNPMTGELFTAEKGKGAYLNGKKLKVSQEKSLDSAMLGMGFPAKSLADNPLHCIDRLADFVAQGIPLRRMGSAALDLSYVAAGRFDGFWELSLQPWDIAAGQLLVAEAGGQVSHYDGKKRNILSRDTFLASNGLLHEALSVNLTRTEAWESS